MSVPIELQVGDPPRTIYEDIVNLPDPVKLGITIRAFNYDDVGLYFQVTAQCSGWTFETENLGLVGSGADIYRNLDEFGSRAKPTSETEQIIKLILKAYTDAGYSNLKWTYERNITIVFIKSDDPSYTVDELDNFDDGTVQGWGAVTESARNVVREVVTDYVLSASYSLQMRQWGTIAETYEERARLYKSFITPDKSVVYAIIDVRTGHEADSGGAWIRNKYIEVRRDGTVLVHVGKLFNTVQADDFPPDKWIRIVVPLPPNTTIEVQVAHSVCAHVTATNLSAYLWMDDFKIISK